MTESGKNEFVGKKAYEIAYALWRLGAQTAEGIFAEKLFRRSIELIDFSADGNFAGIGNTVQGIEAIIKFAVDVNLVTISNAAILMKEIGNLRFAMDGLIKREKVADIDISGLFSNGLKSEPLPEEIFAGIDFDRDSGNPEIGKKAETRQSAILERIRQSGNCRLGDIQAILPESSERTLRYDLESLVQRNLIERMGIGGRSVYYRPKTQS